MILYNLLMVLGFVLFLGLIYGYVQDTRKGTIPQSILFSALGVGYLTKILSLILGHNYGDPFLLYIGVTLIFFGLIITVPENKIGGGDLKLYLAIYLIISNIYLLLFIILISNTLGYIEAKIKKKNKLLFAKHILVSYSFFFVFTLYNSNLFFLF